MPEDTRELGCDVGDEPVVDVMVMGVNDTGVAGLDPAGPPVGGRLTCDWVGWDGDDDDAVPAPDDGVVSTWREPDRGTDVSTDSLWKPERRPGVPDDGDEPLVEYTVRPLVSRGLAKLLGAPRTPDGRRDSGDSVMPPCVHIARSMDWWCTQESEVNQSQVNEGNFMLKGGVGEVDTL